MNGHWERTALGKVLTKSDRWVILDAQTEHKEVTVRLWGRGVALRGIVSGPEIAGSRRMEVRTGEFIASRIDARNGAFGLIPDELDGAVVTNDFPILAVDAQRMLPGYLHWLSKTGDFVESCKAASEGTTNRVRLKEDRFLQIEIPLPPLAEQRRIVAKIERLAGKIEEARGLRVHADCNTVSLIEQALAQTFSELAKRSPTRAFCDFAPHITSGPRYWSQFHSTNGVRFYRAQDIGSDGRIVDQSKQYISPPSGNTGQLARVIPGDLLIVITGATVGRVAVTPQECEPGFVNQHVALCRLPVDQVLPQYALKALLSPQGQIQLLGQRYGQGKPGLNLNNIRALRLPVPEVREQQEIVERLDSLQAKIDHLKALQAQTAGELNALLPAVLDRAFKGEL
jgi:type I restriction enzyme S subunit